MSFNKTRLKNYSTIGKKISNIQFSAPLNCQNIGVRLKIEVRGKE